MNDTDHKVDTTTPGRWYQAEGGFFQLPRAMRYDDRLTHAQRVVLVTIASHVMLRDEVYPSRQAIRSYTGMDLADISSHTGVLEDCGWLSKLQEQGRTTHYQLQVPRYAIDRMRNMQAGAAALREQAADIRRAIRAERLAKKQRQPQEQVGASRPAESSPL